MRVLFTQERVAASANVFLDGLLGEGMTLAKIREEAARIGPMLSLLVEHHHGPATFRAGLPLMPWLSAFKTLRRRSA